MDIIPSINETTKEAFDARLLLVENHFTSAQVDISDGIFVAAKSFDSFGELESTNSEMMFGVHLMVSKPENHVSRWVDLPSVNEICFHVESTTRHLEVIKLIRADSDVSLGMVMNPKTPWKDIEAYVDLLDFVQFMTVEPGPNGNPFVSAVVEKIADFHFCYPDKSISVDGGITPERIEELEKAGVTRGIVGSAITKFFK